MAAPTPSPSRPGRNPAAWLARLRLPRSPWAYALAAAVLLALSQLLWLWHSWPVREILDAERPAAGATI
jgi:integral membrane sensor domain MASE1